MTIRRSPERKQKRGRSKERVEVTETTGTGIDMEEIEKLR
jgi:hypothetical protein